jgi:hypothetical protein
MNIDELYDLVAALRPAWKARAACRGLPWQEVVRGSLALRAACVACPVATECDAEAERVQAEFGEVHGYWAGMAGSERRQRDRAVPLVCPGCGSPFVRTQGKQRWCEACRSTPGAKERARRRMARTAA